MDAKRKGGRPRTFEREPTIALALENYWRDGVHALSVNEVCRRSKLSKPTLYREFGGEDGLLDAALARYNEVVIRRLAGVLAADGSFAELSEAFIQALTSDRVAGRGCLFVKMRSAPGRLGPLATARVEAMIEEVRLDYEAFFLRSLGRGEVRGDVEPRVAAAYLDTQASTVLRQMAAGDGVDDVRAQASLAFGALVRA